MRILVVNGPNMRLLGKREPDVYGTETLEEVETRVGETAASLGAAVEFFQSNHEGDIVDKIGDAIGEYDGIVINPAAFTHTSVAIRDAVAAVDIPTIEVHLSNIHSREEFRKSSVTAPACVGQICGFGILGYEMAVRVLAKERVPAGK